MGGYNYNFNAQSHEALYDKIQGREGNLLSNVERSVQTAFAAQATDDAWNNFRAVMGNAKAEVQQAVIDSGAVWEGTAGESFTGAAAPLVQWAEDARAAGVETHHSVQAQQSHYTSARDEMPEPVVVSSTANDDYLGIPAGLTHLVGGQTDQDVEEGRANAAKAAAVEVMNNYQSGASSAVFGVGVFVPPPRVVAQVVEPETLVSTERQQNVDEYDETYNNRNSRSLDTATTSVQADQRQPVPTQQQRDGSIVDTSGTGTPAPTTSTRGDTTSTTGTTSPQQTPSPAPVVPPPGGPTPLPQQSPGAGPGLLNVRSSGAPPGSRLPGGSRVPSSALGGARGTGGTGSGTRAAVPGQLPGQQPVRGTAPGTGSPTGEPHAAGRPGAPGATGRGGAGSPGAPGMAASPQRGQGEEDTEHKAAAYLQEVDDIWGESDTLVAPPVIGDVER